MSSFPKVFYVYDALCGWCFGFKDNILRLHQEYGGRVEFEVLSGNMVPIENKHHISKMASYISGAYHRVEELSGCKFGEGYLQHILHPEKSDLELCSEVPGIALSVMKSFNPAQSFTYAAALQNALMVDGKDLNKDETYLDLAKLFSLDSDLFLKRLHDEAFRDIAHAEFAMVKQLGITGFPCVLVQTDERKLFMIARGFTHYDDLKQRLEKVLEEFRIANN